MHIASWTIMFAAILAVICIIKYVLIKKVHRKSVRIISDVLLALLALFLGLEIIAFASKFCWRFSRPLCAIYIVLLSDAIANLAYGILYLIKPVRNHIKEHSQGWRKVRIAMLALAAVVMFAYGTVNMQRVVCEDITYTSDKLQQNHDFVFFADVHVGRSQSHESLAKAVDEIEALNPEFVVIGGDVADEYTSKEAMQEAFETIGKLSMPVYFIYGNHDRQPGADKANGRTYSDEELSEAITSNGIIILEDESVQIAPDLVLVGREDGGREDIKEEEANPHERLPLDKLIPETDAYIVDADHQPFGFDEAVKAGVDLQISGHTHAAQIFPMQAIYRLTGVKAYGEFTEGDSTLYVSSGLSGWSYPFRTEEHSAYNAVHLRAE